MTPLKPAYLVHGDDHGAIAERRAGLRALAEREHGASANLALLEGDDATPQGAAEALAAMTLAIGRRVIIVERVERWRQADVERYLLPAMSEMPPDATIALFAREESRARAPQAVHDAVARAGGQIVAQMSVKPWELARWVRAQAARLGVALDAGAAQALVDQVGGRQQRLLRELEKLALEGPAAGETAGAASAGERRRVSAEEIERRAAHSAEWRAYALADAVLRGDRRAATLAYLRLRQQGERLTGLLYVMAQRLREALALSLRMGAGEPAAELRRGLRMPQKAAERLLADVARSEPERLRDALAGLAALELDTRGGAVVAASRAPLAALTEDTIALQAIDAITR